MDDVTNNIEIRLTQTNKNHTICELLFCILQAVQPPCMTEHVQWCGVTKGGERTATGDTIQEG